MVVWLRIVTAIESRRRRMLLNLGVVYDGGNAIKRSTVAWLMVTVILTIIGYIMLWHGSVYLEHTERTGETGYLYLAEIIGGSILLWPVTIYGWLSYWISGSKQDISSFTFFVAQGAGYFALYFLYLHIKQRRT